MNEPGSTARADGAAGKWLNRTVLGAGLTSALGDLCYETATVLLPGLLAVLGLPASALGLIEGSADALASFTRMLAGHAADRLGHRKLLVVLGYALTPLGQALIALAGGWPLLLLGRLTSWFGKGLRGPLRDAIVVQSVTPQTKGRAFGFHRAADTVGAVLGPLLGVALLGWAHGLAWRDPATPFRLVLWLSLIPGALAALAFVALVRDPRRSPNPDARLLRSLRGLPARFGRYLGAVALFGMGDFSASLLILAATRLLAPSLGLVEAAQFAGLLFVWRNVVQVVMSYPIGALADRVGHLPLLVGGYALGALTAALTAWAFVAARAGLPLLATIFLCAGLYVAVEEALEPTVSAEMIDSRDLGLGYGALGTVNGVARFVSSAAVGLLWSAVSPVMGFGLAAVLMACGTVALLGVARSGAR